MISLRDLTMDDVPAVQRIHSGASVTYTRGTPMDEAAAASWTADVVAHARQVSRERWYFGIADGDDLIGVIKLLRRTETLGSISYTLREDTWGRGYATHAVSELRLFAFNVLGLDTITARHHPDNPASGRVLVKAGFVRTGTVDVADSVGGTVAYPVYELHRQQR